ncbi:MAG: hypothetical protein ABIT01_21370 [Thermoanaerobaculia bacterium]
MKFKFRSAGVALLLATAVSSAGIAVAQSSPTGAISLVLTPSTTTPPQTTSFTVDLNINMTAATGICTTGGATVPMALGAYSLGVTFDNTKLSYVGAAVCPTAPAEFSTVPSCNNLGSEVVCTSVNSGPNTLSPTGSVCVLRLTFTNNSATVIGPTSLGTSHTPAPRSIASQLVLSPANCGGGSTFPAGSISDGSVPTITPATLTEFTAD